MDVALDVFVSEDYVTTRRKEKISRKQEGIAAKEEDRMASHVISLARGVTSQLSARGLSSVATTFSEEVVLHCLTP